MSQIEKKMQIEHQYIGTIFGQFDSNIKKIEQACCVQIVNRGDDIKIIGEEKGVTNAENVLHSLEVLVKKGEEITEQNVMYLLQTVEQNYLTEVEKMYDDFICMTVNGRPAKGHGAPGEDGNILSPMESWLYQVIHFSKLIQLIPMNMVNLK